MTKITLTDLVNLENQTTAVNAINANSAVIETAFDNTLSRDGTSPNTMSAALDMNSNQIINLPAPSTVNSPARLIDVVSNPTIVVPGTGNSGHVVPFLDGSGATNHWSNVNIFDDDVVFNDPVDFSNHVGFLGAVSFSGIPLGVVSSVASGTGLTGGPITSTGTLSLDVNGLTLEPTPDQYADTFPIYDSSTALVKRARPRPPRGHIWGLATNNNAGTPLTILDIAAGEAASDHATSPLMMIAGAFTKNINALWAAGSTNGALDAGVMTANTGYHLYMIMRSDTGVVDYILSTNATTPAMPTNYDHKRRIGWIKINLGGTGMLPFKQYEDSFLWATPSSDYATVAITSGVDTTLTLLVPIGIRIVPYVNIVNEAASLSGGFNIRSPDLQLTTPLNVTTGEYATSFVNVNNGAASSKAGVGVPEVITNTSGQIILRAVTGTFTVRTFGWMDSRGRLS